MGDEFTFYKIASVADIPQNERLFIEINGLPIVIYSLNGEFYATGDVCSHDNGALGEGKIEGYEVVCPRHGARFDIRTGKVTRLPAARDIPSYPVKVTDGYLTVGVAKN
jgi:Ferredoxin subunits of nitrite reductase and ring-hydroxylating dioxygenases